KALRNARTQLPTTAPLISREQSYVNASISLWLWEIFPRSVGRSAAMAFNTIPAPYFTREYWWLFGVGRYPFPQSKLHELCCAPAVEFLHQAVAVLADRLRADLQGGSDLLVAVPLGDQLEHLPFARGQHRKLLDRRGLGRLEIALDDHARNRGA